MIDFPLLFIASFVIYGINFATDYSEGDQFKMNGYKNVAWKLRYWSLKYVGEFWTRPLFSCVMCMSSVYGTLFYFSQPENWHISTLYQWPVFLVALCGLNRLLRNFV